MRISKHAEVATSRCDVRARFPQASHRPTGRRRFPLAVLAAALMSSLILTGCASRRDYKSADFSGNKVYARHGNNVPQLSENEVLGLKGGAQTTDEDIRRTLDETRSVRVPAGSKVLLVQSGASHPDSEMVQELSKHLSVVPHTGVPSEVNASEGDAGKSLRLAAARSNAETLIVYWGKLELFRDDLPTSIVSWLPVVDFAVPDEYQKVRMQLTVAVVDVRTGQWATYRTEPIEEDTLTTRYNRERNPKWSLERTKERLYRSAVKKLAEGYLAAQVR